MTKLWAKIKIAFQRKWGSFVCLWVGGFIGAYLQHFSGFLGNAGLATATASGFIIVIIIFTKVD